MAAPPYQRCSRSHPHHHSWIWAESKDSLTSSLPIILTLSLQNLSPASTCTWRRIAFHSTALSDSSAIGMQSETHSSLYSTACRVMDAYFAAFCSSHANDLDPKIALLLSFRLRHLACRNGDLFTSRIILYVYIATVRLIREGTVISLRLIRESIRCHGNYM